MDFSPWSLTDLSPAYQPQPYPLHDEHHYSFPIRQQHGLFGVDQTSSTTWQAQTLGGPAVQMQQHALQAFHPALRAGHHRFNAGLNDNDRSFSASTPPLVPEMRLTSSKRPRKPKAVTTRSADWEPYRKAILTLHLEQNMPLRKVQQMIEKEYGFKAELRQYQSRISQWGQDKNVKPQEMQAIVRKHQKRKLIEPHKRGLVFEVRGNEVDRQKIERWMKRHNASESFLYATSPVASTPSAVECHTEPGSPMMTTISVYSVPSSPAGADFAAQSPHTTSTTLSLTGIVRSPTDNFPERNSVHGPQSLPNLDLSFIYSLSDSESIMNRTVQVLYKKEEEKRWLSELIIADLAMPGDPWEIVRTLYGLGEVLWYQGRYNGAENVACTLIECHRSRLGDSSDDAEMLYAMNLLFDTLYSQRSYVRAETLCFRTMKGKGVLARKDPNRDTILGNFVRMAKALNKLEEAESVSRHAIEEATKIHGPKHSVTLRFAMELGSVLRAQKRYKEAETMLSNTLALSEEVLGLGDIETLWGKHLLVELFVNQKRYKEAEQLQRRSLSTAKKASGPEGVTTLVNMGSLSDILENQGRYEEAEALLRETLILFKKVCGSEHPYTLTSMASLGNMIKKQGRYKEAEAVFRETMISRKKVHGPEHPATLATMNELGAVLGDQGRYAEAEAVFREAMISRKKVLGPENPATLIIMNRLGIVLVDQDRFAEAEAVFRETMVLRKNVLGHKHPRTLNSIDWLRWVLEKQGRFEEADSVS